VGVTVLRRDRPAVRPAGTVIDHGGAADYSSQLYDPALYCAKPGDASKRLLYLSVMGAPLGSGTGQGGVFQVDPALVESPSGYTYLGLAVPEGGTGAWDHGGARLGTGFVKDGTVSLYYTGGVPGSGTSIGLTTSATGLAGSFTKHASNPLLTPTGNGRNDGDHVSEPAVLTDGPGGPPLLVNGTYWLMYGYRNGGSVLPGYRLATSSDLVSWTKYTAVGDVLTRSPYYAEWHQWYYEAGLYWLIYETGGATTTTYPFRIGVACSGTVNGPYTPMPTGWLLEASNDPARFDRYHVATAAHYREGALDLLFYQGASDHLQPYYTNPWDMAVARLVSDLGFAAGGGRGRGGR
jgi:hypothetical protein